MELGWKGAKLPPGCERERGGRSSYPSSAAPGLPCLPAAALGASGSCIICFPLAVFLPPLSKVLLATSCRLCWAPSLLSGLCPVNPLQLLLTAVRVSKGQKKEERVFLDLSVSAWPDLTKSCGCGQDFFFNQKRSAPSIKPQKTSVFRAVWKSWLPLLGA